MKKKYGVLSQNIWKIPKKVRLLFDLDLEKKNNGGEEILPDNMKNKPSFLLGLVMHSLLQTALPPATWMGLPPAPLHSPAITSPVVMPHRRRLPIRRW
jgi:hypothetical protein